MEKITLLANAKINLHLDIEGKKDNGYHNIISNMQSVSLCDVITLIYEPSDKKEIRVFCNKEDIPTDSKNIAYKAADLILDSGCLDIYIEKNIPSPAGLAGGSADAAAVIYGLCKIANIDKTQNEIMSIAARVGADVPFCLMGGNKNIMGIGDIISEGENIPEKYILIAIKGDGVSTPIAYGMLDKLYCDFESYTPQKHNVAENLENGVLFNIFEDVIFDVRPNAKEIKDIMQKCGGISLMSGSGPSVFGLFDSKDLAEKAERELIAIGASVYLCGFAEQGIVEA